MADNGGILELFLLNEQMGMVGIFVGGCDLRFYTRVLVYGVKFGPSGPFMIEKFNRFHNEWESVMFGGTLQQTTDTLNSFGPFLTPEEITEYWGGLTLPTTEPHV